jgi:hypothetical protein
VRRARRLFPAAAFFVSAALLLVDFRLSPTFLYRIPQPDFFVYYLAAQLGWTQGWGAMYDPSIFQPAVTTVVGRYLPYLNPPMLAWLVIPLSWLPYRLAAWVWTGVLAGALGATWFIAAPGRQPGRLIHLVAAAAALPVFTSFLFGEVSLVIVAIVAGSWWLLDDGRPWLAGLVLACLALKPQVAFLVPLALLAAGHWRVFLSWLGATVVMVTVSLLAVGTQAIHDVRHSLSLAAGTPGPIQVSLLHQVPWPVVSVAAMVAVAGLLVIVAVSAAGARPALPMAAGLLGSALLTPYLNFYDLAGLVLAAWLVLRTNPPMWQRFLLVALYIPLYLAPVWPLVTVVCECGWLASLVILGWLQRDQALRGRYTVAPQMPRLQASP